MALPSLTVLIPTRNSSALLPEHLENVLAWVDLAQEIIVVDSNSTDGTLELIQQRLRHPAVRVMSHPPGLYQSWNFGFQKATGHHTYVSTVGDSIAREGLTKLQSVAARYEADVIVSKPRFVDEAGNSRRDDEWPIDGIIKQLSVSEPTLLTPFEQLFFAMVNFGGAILGSSASNLYRTACMQARPFPTEFGTVGDGAWGMINAPEVKIVIHPEKFSTFRHHAKSYSDKEYRVDFLPMKLFTRARQTMAEFVLRDSQARDLYTRFEIARLEVAIEAYLTNQVGLEAQRHRRWPWVANPRAWRARQQRQAHLSEITTITRAVVGEFRRLRGLSPNPDSV